MTLFQNRSPAKSNYIERRLSLDGRPLWTGGPLCRRPSGLKLSLDRRPSGQQTLLDRNPPWTEVLWIGGLWTGGPWTSDPPWTGRPSGLEALSRRDPFRIGVPSGQEVLFRWESHSGQETLSTGSPFWTVARLSRQEALSGQDAISVRKALWTGGPT